MPNNKIVIPFPQSNYWTFYDWVDGDGSNPIEKWLAGESEEVRMKFNSMLKLARKSRNHLDWLGFRHKMEGQLRAEGINELEFKADRRQYRLLIKFDGVLKMVILCGCYHKEKRWTPTDALETAVRRSKALSQGKARKRERTIQDDL